MSNTETKKVYEDIVLHGTAVYAKVNKPQPDGTNQYGQKIPAAYSINIIPDKIEVSAGVVEGEDKCSAFLEKNKFNSRLIEKDIAGLPDATGKVMLNVKRKVITAAGNISEKPVCVDCNGRKYDGNIGNGSRVIVKASYTDYFDQTRKEPRNTTYLKGVQVVDLVEYTDGAMFSKVDGSFKVSDSTTTEDEHTGLDLGKTQEEADEQEAVNAIKELKL